MPKVMLTIVAVVGMAALLSGTALASDGEPSKPVSKVTTVSTSPTPKTYVVQSGDNLSTIAQTEQLSSWLPLWDANTNITDPNLIYQGEQLDVPTGPVADRPLPSGYVDPTTNSPAPVQPSATYSYVPQQTQSANYAAGSGGLMARIRERESGGNYADNTGNGYYGAYQFSLGTWESVGGTGLPSNASPAEQDALAQKLYSERGCSPWPNTCY